MLPVARILCLAGLLATLATAVAGQSAMAATAPAQRGVPHHSRTNDLATGAQPAATGSPLVSGGGPVITSPAVYLSFWGSEWSAGFSTGGYSSSTAVTYLENFFAAAGGSGWAGVTTQYCQGVASGSTSCPSTATFVTNPPSQYLGAWVDPYPVPASPTDADIQAAASRAQGHFGYRAGAVYFVMTPTGKSQTGFGTSWCAWHGGLTNNGVSIPYAYLPYMPDAGSACGVDSVNPNDSTGHGYFDGYSIVGGHEYQEAVTDPFPNSGWIDSAGQENADKCQWGGRQTNYTFPNGSYFAVQPTWSNAIGGCQLAIAPAPAPTPTPTPTPVPAPTPAPSQAAAFHGLSPARVFDTRTGQGGHLGRLGPGESFSFTVPGPPAGATAAVLNVGVTEAGGAASSYVLVSPADQPLPVASTVNVVAGQTIANLSQVRLSAAGAVTVYNAAGYLHVFIDLEGYYAPAAAAPNAGLYNPLPAPQRVLDTRGGGALGAGGSLRVQVTGVKGVPAGAAAVVLNLTEVGGTQASYLSAWPDGTAQPVVSNLNFPAGRVLANRAIVRSTNGWVDVYNAAGTADVLVDVAGWFSGGQAGDTAGSRFTPTTPTRIFDSRSSLGGHPRPLGAGESVAVGLTGNQALALNVTGLDATTFTFIGLFPAPPANPQSSDINLGPGDILPNHAVAGPAGSGFVIYNAAGSVDVFADLDGTYAA